MEALLSKLVHALGKQIEQRPSSEHEGAIYDAWTDGFPSRGGEACFPLVYQAI